MPKMFSDRTKEDAVRDVLSGKASVASRAKGLKIHVNTLYRWKDEYLAKNSIPANNDMLLGLEAGQQPEHSLIEAKLTKLRAEIHILEQAQHILNGKT